MVIIYLKGGLGNQLFQYGFGIFLKNKLKTSIYFDISHFQDKRNLNSKYPRSLKVDKLFTYFHLPFYSKYQMKFLNINIFNPIAINLPKLLFNCIDENSESDFVNNSVYNGYWQKTEYLIDSREELRNDYLGLKLINSFSRRYNYYYDIISKDSFSVCVHIRLGDLFINNIDDRLDEQYYISAIEKNFKNEKYNFYVFSENLTTCREMLKSIKTNLIFIEIENSENQDLYEFELMRLCKNFILSKSTFSWMSYFLSDVYSKPAIVIQPNNFLI